ncbi:hypothetical protein D3C75_857250 [compost metagenome]
MAAGDRAVRDLLSPDRAVSQLFRADTPVLQLLAADRMIQQLASADAPFSQMLARYRLRGQFGRGNRLIRDVNALYRIILQPRRADNAKFQLGPVNRPGSDFRAGHCCLRNIISVHLLQAFLFRQQRYRRHS